ncbi:uncharacterized protein BX664DRAFT_310316 [Halteromyces radiatus]|uniref:uncharacterized protein n=1 Tax=Halteromyces radiatus TaxID=101107 RepID=UPI00221ECF5A|nr:uncharacterized protein BX664DRAFT_310316 [Halteromyces radiatus]KAI8099333.1 hypothetical protein BX664DRAFT_310316 [Halteromyces radiatus]
MSYCQRCGELGRTEKCLKCGTTLISNSSIISRISNVDRWQSSKYVDDVVNKVKECTIHKKQQRPSPFMNRRIPRNTILPALVPDTHKKKSTRTASTCSHCHQLLSGKIVQLPDDDDNSNDNNQYHWSCLVCHECKEPFLSTEVYLNSQSQVYHPKCAAISPVVEKTCDKCQYPILEKYLSIHTSILHLECFRCTGCDIVLKSASIYCHKDPKPNNHDQIYCRPCHQAHFPEDQHTITNDGQWKIVPQPYDLERSILQLKYPNNSSPTLSVSMSSCSSISSLSTSLTSSPSSPHIDTMVAPTETTIFQPSQLMKSKVYRPLPQFGTVKVCPGCQERIVSVHEERTGPRAAKWHRHCLACHSCHKPLDSSAKVYQAPGSQQLIPSCTTCLLLMKNINTKRNSEFLKDLCKT